MSQNERKMGVTFTFDQLLGRTSCESTPLVAMTLSRRSRGKQCCLGMAVRKVRELSGYKLTHINVLDP